MTQKGTAVSIVLLFLGLLAYSFAGTDLSGIHSECADGIDNDSSFNSVFTYSGYTITEQGTDANDFNCFFYPYADGNGEDETPAAQQFNRNSEYESIFEYHRDFGGLISVCHGLRFSGELVSGGALIVSEPIYSADEVADATTYVIDQTGAPPSTFMGCPP